MEWRIEQDLSLLSLQHMTPSLRNRLSENCANAFKAAWKSALKFRRIRKPSEWAVEERFLAVGSSPLVETQAKRFTHDSFPHCVEQMDSLDDPSVKFLVIWAAIRDGKTSSVCLSGIGRMVDDTGGNAYSVHPTEDDADKFSEQDLETMIESSPSIREKFVKRKSRDAGRTKGFKKYSGGSIRIVTAGSATKFRGTSVRLMCLHELDALPAEIIAKAEGRVKGYRKGKIIKESTCTSAPELNDKGEIKQYRSNIHEAYDLGDQRNWFCSCKKCGHLQTIKFKQFGCEDGDMAKGHYACEACEYQHSPAEFRTICATGKWFPTAGLTDEEKEDILANFHKAKAKNPAVRSYWRNGFNSLLPHHESYANKIHEYLAEAEDAKRDPQKFKTWQNEIAAELHNPESESEAAPDWQPIYNRRENYADEKGNIIVPRGALWMGIGIDVHPDRIEFGKIGYGRREEAWHLRSGVVWGDKHDEATWTELEGELQRAYTHELGGQLGVGLAFCDCSHGAEQVGRWLLSLRDKGSPLYRKVFACRGAITFPHPIVVDRHTRLMKNLFGFWVGGDEGKDYIYAKLRAPIITNQIVPDGFRHYGKNCDRKFFEQLTAEQVSIEFKNGEEIRRYKNPLKRRNEQLDLALYSLAAFKLRQRRIDWDALEKELTVEVKAEKKPAAEKSNPFASMAGASGIARRW